VHADELGGDGDHVAGPVGHQENALSRGSSFDTFW